ncbi:glutamate synthase large subunit [Dorea formicigenerans]|jgi:glutamate synthase (NADPH) large chain|uniref:Glutamate synthase large subunit n=1 Tax=Dorea formicigenerans TaxID=39486 RepID=A0A3E5EWE2_9FIRM|nr:MULTISPECIES: glutamate synthase large subunit [Dorea]MBT9741052.1 glutamate synthase large subunit [Dorea formicigenerans]MCB6508495.1 glutamate synthase large subunit [Dorea sp. 210702-DFI.3.125]NSE60476.1 glutamate synthase large subunit [Dorea formicigenerans]NSE88104.1 glutamate synthase large subunit [Dorea formicigenerans]RGJ66456.1 glutamate synthase large subunit [Dorea formicigenerans]
MNGQQRQKNAGLYRPSFEHDNCGIGAIVNIKGQKSHDTVANALKIVEQLEHRAGKDAEGKTGDGVGILLQISHKFFSKVCKPFGIFLGSERDYGVGMFFFPQDELKRNQAKNIFEVIVEKEGMEFLGWREVPVHPDVLGSRAVECMPCIMQGFIKRPEKVEKGIDFDRRLYVVRRVFEQSSDDTYVASLSSRTIAYKGMFLVDQLRLFFADLQDKDYESAIALVHSRFSTNTNPSWERAHPNRFIVHNGEINTIRGNRDKMQAREENMESEDLKGELHKVLPAINATGSDSAMLDNAIEFMVMSGMELPLAVMISIPEPWANNKSMSQKKKDFYQYYATMMEPWDGPASILFSDGDCMGAVLDRNGLRPSRYYITDDDQLILSSEVGVMDIAPEKIIVKERLRPGKMLLVDTVQGRVIGDEELKEMYADRQPYGEWLDSNLIELKNLKIPNQLVPTYRPEDLKRLQKAFGYSYEEVETSIKNMALNGGEGTAAMGIDTPLAVLSDKHQNLFNYFKQLFAQVTNPPIDAIREEVVTSTTVYIGADGNLLEEKAENCKMLKVNNPILTNVDLLKIKNMKQDGFKIAEIPTIYYKNSSLEKAMDYLFIEVDRAIRDGANILILSDRGVDEYHVAMPSLLALSGLQQHLVRTKKRTSVAIILETGEPREVHHFATLLGYGACAVNPYLAHETIRQLIDTGMLQKDYYAAVDDYNHGILSGIVKIASKMGISTIQSYQGAKIFEAIGLKEEFINKYFTDTVSRVGGIGIEEIAQDYLARHSQAFDPLGLEVDLTLDSLGQHKSRSCGEEHLYNPRTIHMLQQSTRLGNYEMFKQYTDMVNEEGAHINLRGQLDFNYPKKGIPIEEVESVDEIVQRFKTGAMSYGSISKEAHETLAIAMNRLHGKSNSGEGGEEIERLDTEKCSAIKQVASGRFGVTSRYLVSAKEIQIKMAQGAKPGEGGHLPGGKVYPWIAKTRHSTPGVSLISPPPHHDIYSIEDLAQLIYDCKNANKDARISVKLVSEAGVGTVAAGVAKAGAGLILISGYDGGTGAAAKSSIHNAGLPWELGLAETHQTLIQNGLRERVRIETDGKLMSGRDVAIAAILGAEEFGFATAPLVTMGCVMMRVCNLDTCPVGVATQNPELRKNFRGKPEYVINFMRFIAQNLREYMAKLGVRTIDELVGRTDLLKVKEVPTSDRAATLDLSQILQNPYEGTKTPMTYNPKKIYDFELEKTLDERVLVKELLPALEKHQKRSLEVDVTNTNRTFGTIFGSEITRRYPEGVEEDSYVIKCTGAGGQSFGAFIPKGLTLELVGDGNDYFGKGLSGGKLIVYPPKGVTFKHEENIIIGNVALYGATSGKAFINGVAGERFAVRNSGAKAVVEGVGDHGCEYMTGGCVVVLGKTGKNFAAGMSGGVAYVLDLNSDLYKNINKQMVNIERVTSKFEINELKEMIEEHVAYTNSESGKEILDHFTDYLPKFKKIIPIDYEKMLSTIVQMEEQGMSSEQARIEAFYAIKEGRR